MIAGLVAERSDLQAVLEDEHAVAIEATDDGSGVARPEASLGNSELMIERLAERHGIARGELIGADDRHGLHRVRRYLFLSGRCDGDFLANGRHQEVDLDGFGRVVGEEDFEAAVVNALDVRRDGVSTGGEAGEGEVAVGLREGGLSTWRDRHARVLDGALVVADGDDAGDGAGAGTDVRGLDGKGACHWSGKRRDE